MCAWMPCFFIGVISNKIKWLSHQGKVGIKVLPDQAYALWAVLLQSGDEPQPQAPKILEKVSTEARKDQDSWLTQQW